MLRHVFQTAGLPDRANFSDFCFTRRTHPGKVDRVGGNGKASTAFAIDSIEQQGTHTMEISIGGSSDKNIYVMNVVSCREG